MEVSKSLEDADVGVHKLIGREDEYMPSHLAKFGELALGMLREGEEQEGEKSGRAPKPLTPLETVLLVGVAKVEQQACCSSGSAVSNAKERLGRILLIGDEAGEVAGVEVGL
jgi:hypothetical protein